MPATVTLSIEIELGWSGARTAPISETPLSAERSAETAYLHRLLSVADEYDVPITFDVVGHLLEESCSGDHEGPHSSDWFDVDPGTDVNTDPLFYAPDLIGAIVDAEVNHEIATHTYSHIHCEDEPPETLAAELDAAATRHRRTGLSTPTSFVPPYHESPSREVCRTHGIDVIRRPFQNYERPAGSLRSFYWTLSRSHPVKASERSDGLLETYCTPHPSLTQGFLQNGTEQPRREYRYLPLRARQKRHYRYLVSAVRAAIDANSEVHLWTHLYNLANEEQFPQIHSFFERVSEFREDKKITIQRMSDLSENDA